MTDNSPPNPAASLQKDDRELIALRQQQRQLQELIVRMSSIQERSSAMMEKLVAALEDASRRDQGSARAAHHDELLAVARRTAREEVEALLHAQAAASEQASGTPGSGGRRPVWIAVALALIILSLVGLGYSFRDYWYAPLLAVQIDPEEPPAEPLSPEADLSPPAAVAGEADSSGSDQVEAMPRPHQESPASPPPDEPAVEPGGVPVPPPSSPEPTAEKRLEHLERSAEPLLIAPNVSSSATSDRGKEPVGPALSPGRHIGSGELVLPMDAADRFATPDVTGSILGVTSPLRIDGPGDRRPALDSDPAGIMPLPRTSDLQSDPLPSNRRSQGEPHPGADPSAVAEQLAERTERGALEEPQGRSQDESLAAVPVHTIDGAVGEQIQKNLISLGFHSGEVDGMIGPMTRKAIQRFQESIGRAPTGVLTPDEMYLLSEAAERASGVPDGPADSAASDGDNR